MAVLLQYNFTTDLLPTTTATGVTGSQITNQSLSYFTIDTLGYSADPILVCNPILGASTAALAVTNASYFFVTISPTNGNTISLTTMTFNIAKGGASTPRGYAVRSSADSYVANLATADVTTQRTTFTAVSVDLSGASFQNLTTNVAFRVYIYAPTDGNSLDIDALTINGTVGIGSAGAVEQEGFIFYNDNAGESLSSGLAAQDTNIIREKTTNTRLRVLLNSTNDRGSETYQLEYRKVGDASWNVIV